MGVKKNSAEAEITRTIRSSQLKGGLRRFPDEFLASSFTLLDLIFITFTGIPDEDTAIFRTRNEMLGLSLGGVLLINLHTVGNKLNISNKVLVRLRNFTESNVLALDSGLLGLVCFFIRHLSDLDLPTSSDNSVFSGT